MLKRCSYFNFTASHKLDYPIPFNVEHLNVRIIRRVKYNLYNYSPIYLKTTTVGVVVKLIYRSVGSEAFNQ